jgi:hypothetical protein
VVVLPPQLTAANATRARTATSDKITAKLVFFCIWILLFVDRSPRLMTYRVAAEGKRARLPGVSLALTMSRPPSRPL